jgi:prepilin-type N-terminal cleavage/methylation domain-containing protein
MRSTRGFTLIELMIVVAIIGVLAAIAIPAYRDYVKRARMSEVLAVFDALATGANEYHAAVSFFPSQSYGANNLAFFSDTYANVSLNNTGDKNYSIIIVANFKPTLDLTLLAGEGELWMQITYDLTEGYVKTWDLTSSTVDAMFIPRK